MKRKINSRFMIITAAAIFITAAVSTLLFYIVLEEQVFQDLKAYTHLAQQADIRQFDAAQDKLRLTLIAQDGTVLYDNLQNEADMENHSKRPEIEEAGKSGEGKAVRWSNTVSVHTFYYAVRLSDQKILRTAKMTDSLYHVMLNAIVIILLISLATFILCAAAAHMLTRRMVEPIEKMADNLVMLDESNVYEEIRPFIATIKEQHVNILNHVKMRQEFTANVSHELKTPLTAISGYAELIENGMAGKEDTARFAGQIKQNADRLFMLINDIIKLSELDSQELSIQFEAIDLYEAAQSCVHSIGMTAQKHEIFLLLSGEHVTVNGDRGLIEELIYNLLSNAIRYNRKGGSVHVTTGLTKERPYLLVEDTGIGIPKEYQERIFERFYRVDKSRSKSTGGTGLGLAIVKHIAAQHNAKIELKSAPGKGTEILVIF